MRNKILFLSLLLTWYSNTNAQISVLQSHPRILLNTAMIQKLQQRASSNTPEWQQLQTRINAISGYDSHFIMQNVYGGEQYAFMFALSHFANGNVAHRDTALSIFRRYFYEHTTDSSMFYDSGYESRSTMVEIAMLYDWLYNYMPASFRTDVRNRLIHWANWILTKPNIYGIWTGPYYYEGNNYTMGHFVGITSVGFSIQSEDPVNGNKFIAKSDSIRPFLMNYTNTKLKNGDANEGWGYGAGYAINYFKALAIYKTATSPSINHFANTTYDEDVIKFLPFASLPNLTHMLPEGDWARESTGELWEYHRLAAELASSYSDNSQTQQVAAFWANEAVPFNKFAVTAFRWFPFLFLNKEVAPVDYRTLPFYQNNYIYTDSSGTDQFIRRTSWNQTGQWVSYRAGGRYGDHAHNGSGHFSLYDQGWLLIDNNIKTNSGIEGSDSMHNCIHIEKMNNFEMYPFHEPIERSATVRVDLNPEYSYLWTNSAPIYQARSNVFNNVDKNQRQFLYLPDIKKIAVYDMVKTKNVADKKWFGINFNGTPTLSTDSSYSYYANGNKSVFINTCYPLNRKAQRYNNSIRISAKQNAAEQKFMHLVSVLPNSSATINVLSVNKDNGRVLLSDFYGSYHADNGMDYCILFAGDDPAYSHDSLVYEVPHFSQVLRSYLAGLSPLTGFYVSFTTPMANTIRVRVSKLNHPNSIQYTSTSGGLLVFNVPDYVGVKEMKSNEQFYNIFFNRENREVCIENNVKSLNPVEIKIYNALGSLVKTGELTETKKTISMLDMCDGVYIVTVGKNDSYFRKKVLVH